VIGVVGGSGGVGASTFAAGLARLAAHAESVSRAVLVEIDPTSGGIDVLLGVEGVAGPRWSGLRLAGGRLEAAALAEGLPTWSSVAFVAADVTPSADSVAQLLPVARRVGPVVVDLPRWPAPARSAALTRCDLVVLITGCDVASIAGARSVAAGLGTGLRIALIVRGDAEAHFSLARALGKAALSQSPKSRIKYAKDVRNEALACLKIEPKHAGCLHVMGMWNAEVMRLNGFTKMLAKNFLGGQIFDSANWAEAKRYMEESVANEPDRIVHHIDLAGVYRDTGDKEKARAQWQAVMKLPNRDFNDRHYKAEADAGLSGR